MQWLVVGETRSGARIKAYVPVQALYVTAASVQSNVARKYHVRVLSMELVP